MYVILEDDQPPVLEQHSSLLRIRGWLVLPCVGRDTNRIMSVSGLCSSRLLYLGLGGLIFVNLPKQKMAKWPGKVS